MASKKPKRSTHGVIIKVRLGDMHFRAKGQRKVRQHRVNKFLADPDLEQIGVPTLNWRDDAFQIVDGQHRIAFLQQWLGDGWEKQQIPCRVYYGLTEVEEAQMFRKLNDNLKVNAFEYFMAGIDGNYEEETAIAATVDKQGLVITRDRVPGAVRCVSPLTKVYRRGGYQTLGKTLRIIRDAFGDVGFESMMIDGLGFLCQRYDGVLKEDVAVERLSATRGGAKGLLGRAEILHQKTGAGKAQCVAAAAVDLINATRGGKKLPSWWRTE
jgi:hypothetical protein